MIGSWIWELKRWMQKKQKNTADNYNNRVVALISAAQNADSTAELEQIWRELLTILAEAVQDLDADKISEDSFHSFRAILQIAMEVTRDRRVVFNLPG